MNNLIVAKASECILNLHSAVFNPVTTTDTRNFMNYKLLAATLLASTCAFSTTYAAQATATTPPSNLNQAGIKNLQAQKQFLSENTKKEGVVTLKSGLQYKIIKPGKGTPPKLTDSVTVDYTGKTIDGRVFDSSANHGGPATFPVNAVIPGWTIALQKMRPGATWELYIPSSLAYGSRGAGNAIGPNELLIFTVHLREVKN